MSLGLALLAAWALGLATAIGLRYFCDRLRDIEARRNANAVREMNERIVAARAAESLANIEHLTPYRRKRELLAIVGGRRAS